MNLQIFNQQNFYSPALNPGKVLKVLNPITVEINKGSIHGICQDDCFLVYELGDTLFDPDSGKNLGILELVKGVGIATLVKEISTRVTSAKVKPFRRELECPYTNKYGEIIKRHVEIGKKIVPFENPSLGNLVKYYDPNSLIYWSQELPLRKFPLEKCSLY